MFLDNDGLEMFKNWEDDFYKQYGPKLEQYKKNVMMQFIGSPSFCIIYESERQKKMRESYDMIGDLNEADFCNMKYQFLRQFIKDLRPLTCLN